MLPKTDLNYRQYKLTMLVIAFLGSLLIFASFILKKQTLFLLLNGDMGAAADAFFKYFTHVGDGLFWFLWLPLVVIKRGKKYLPLLLSAIVFSTLLTQISKQVIYPDEPRPLQAIADQTLVHYVQGVTIHSINSFPSGHTATAFSFLLILSLFNKSSRWIVLGFAIALLVAYSRIYLGQHFPLDVGAGMLVAVGTMLLSVMVQKRFENITAESTENRGPKKSGL
ncbi:MAG: phosphatase PAP2 family protein [Chitinophagaceae bacterium]|nr:phosphatase PAP2 family protein [Chitinophagaceae bacterium]